MSSPYSQLAQIYDSLMSDVDYADWAAYLHKLMVAHGVPGPRVLDLGCGTGTISLFLAQAGYSITGVDLSSDMLAIAANKGLEQGFSPSRWRNQDMRELSFSEQSFDAVVCACDGINYLANLMELEQTLSGIHRCLAPQGLLLFDVHSDYKMRQVFANGQFIQESAEGYCVWTSEFDEASGDCLHEMTIFVHQKQDLYRRTDESHKQHYFSPDTLMDALTRTGFELLGVLAWGTSTAPAADDERIQIVARRSNG